MELDILSALGVLALFVLFAIRAVIVALRAPDRFGMLLTMAARS